MFYDESAEAQEALEAGKLAQSKGSLDLFVLDQGPRGSWAPRRRLIPIVLSLVHSFSHQSIGGTLLVPLHRAKEPERRDKDTPCFSIIAGERRDYIDWAGLVLVIGSPALVIHLLPHPSCRL